MHDETPTPDASPDLLVSEIFATVQGEGMTLGHPCVMVRLAGCNLACSWCDTKYTWDWEHYSPSEETTRMSARQIVEYADTQFGRRYTWVITGGEPLLQQHKLHPLLRLLYSRGVRIEVETAGTILPSPDTSAFVDCFNVSPKLANSGNAADARYRPDILRALNDHDDHCFKFVCATTGDVQEAAAIAADLHLTNVFLMPEGRTPERIVEVAQRLLPVMPKWFVLSPRLHVLLWGDKRGV